MTRCSKLTPRSSSPLSAIAAGLVLSAAFPIAIPGVAEKPLLDALPRELLVLPAAAFIFVLHREPQRLRYAFLVGWVHFMTLLFWVALAMVRYGGVPWILATLILAGLAAYCALFIAIIPSLTRVLALNASLPAPLAFSAAVVVSEWLRSEVMTGFPWGLWGYSQARNLPLANLAAWGGVYLVSAALAATAACFAEGRLNVGRGSRWWSCVGVGVFVVAHIPGGLRLSSVDSRHRDLDVVLMQGHIEQTLKNHSGARATEIMRIYQGLLGSAEAARAELVVWPESSWPYLLPLDAKRLEIDVPISMVVGAVEYGEDNAVPRAYNSALYRDGSGIVESKQRKLRLVPFGEYVPLRRWLPIDKIVPGLIDLTPGAAATPLGPYAIGALICFDGIFPDVTRAHVAAGARILANLTNDGWYGFSSGPYQHLAFYVFRAIESDRVVLRSTNTGVSAFIGPRGRIAQSLPLGVRGVVRGQVELRDGLTVYHFLGDWPVVFSVLLFASVVVRVITSAWSYRQKHR